MFLKQVHLLEPVRFVAEISQPIHEPCLSAIILLSSEMEKSKRNSPNIGVHILKTNREAK